MSKSELSDSFQACMFGGAIGDAWGSSFENQTVTDHTKTFFLGGRKEPERVWSITDDTQLNMATCETLSNSLTFDPALLAQCFLRYYKEKKINGPGSSTLKALTELDAGMHWSQTGRSGEYSAGNGAAMRIAPFAFFKNISREDIRNACRITHKNEEAYVGALAIVLSLQASLSKEWTGDNNLLEIIIPELPDTRVRDRLIEINGYPENTAIYEIAKIGTNGYVVNSVPFAILAASKVKQLGFEGMMEKIINAGGDTDTNASMAGQIAGCLLGTDGIPSSLMQKLKLLPNYDWLAGIIMRTASH